MISFQFNKPPSAITNDQFITLTSIMAHHGWDLDYDVVEGDTAGIIWLWVHPADGTNPTRNWIAVDGELTLEEEVTWDWKGTTDDND